MNRDDIIRMAREAGWDMDDTVDGFSVRLERFFHLAAAAGANAALEAAARQVLRAWDNPVGAKDFCVAMDALRAALKERKE